MKNALDNKNVGEYYEEFLNEDREYDRPEWDEYFLSIAKAVSSRSTCLRRSVGAVIVRNNCMISTGYNGAPMSISHCRTAGCLRQKLNIPSGVKHEICRGSHAEINAICQAAAMGVSTEGATIYCTHEPCVFCTKAIINSKMTRIVFQNPYPDDLARTIRDESSLIVNIM